MRCEDVRELLPAHVDAEPHVPGEIESHLASCEGCRAELRSYRELLAALGALRDGAEETSPDLLERLLALAPESESTLAARAIGSVRAHPVLVSAGAAAVGAAAVAAVWRRRRSATPAAS